MRNQVLQKFSRNKLAFLFAIIVLSGCTTFFTVQMLESQLEPGVDKLFSAKYDQLGGEDLFGPPISGLIIRGNIQYQHFQSGTIMYDPARPAGSQVLLAPIGSYLNYRDPIPSAVSEDAVTINGYLSIPEFDKLYQQFGGQAVFGKALCNVRFNREFNRLEQYFTNFGLYLSAGSTEASFLAYGEYSCTGHCQTDDNTADDVLAMGTISEPFLSTYLSIGSSMTGRLLNGPISIDDGGMEMIFENLVLQIGQDETQVEVKPISSSLGNSSAPLAEKLNDSRVYFFEIEDKLGHNIVQPFVDQITRHGGFPVSGAPTTEGYLLRENVYRQCFTNICLDYYVNAPANLNVIPVDMGREYFEVEYQSIPQPTQVPPASAFDFIAYAGFPVILADKEQSIFASLHHGLSPQVAVEMTLTLVFPDGKQRVYALPPTDANGETEIEIPAISDVEPGIVQVKICLNNPAYQIPCIEQSYQIVNP